MSIGRYVVSRPIPPSYLLGFGGRFVPDPFKTHAIIFFIPSSSNRTFSHFRPTTLGSQFRGPQTHTLSLIFFRQFHSIQKNWRSFHFFIICLWFLTSETWNDNLLYQSISFQQPFLYRDAFSLLLCRIIVLHVALSYPPPTVARTYLDLRSLSFLINFSLCSLFALFFCFLMSFLSNARERLDAPTLFFLIQ